MDLLACAGILLALAPGGLHAEGQGVAFSSSAAQVTGLRAMVSTSSLFDVLDARPPLPDNKDVVPLDLSQEVENNLGLPAVLRPPAFSDADLQALAAPTAAPAAVPAGLFTAVVEMSTSAPAKFEIRDQTDSLAASWKKARKVEFVPAQPGHYFATAVSPAGVEEESFTVPATVSVANGVGVYRFLVEGADMGALTREIILASYAAGLPAQGGKVTYTLPSTLSGPHEEKCVVALASAVGKEFGAVVSQAATEPGRSFVEVVVGR